MSETPLKIYTDPNQSESTVKILGNVLMLESKLENMPAVETAEQAEIVSEYRAQLNRQAKELDKERLAMTAPVREHITMLNQKYNVHIERAERACKLCDNLLMPYMKEQRRKREEAERKAAAEKRAEEEARQVAEEAERAAEKIAAETQDAEALKEAESRVTAAKAGLNELRSRPVAPTPAKSVVGMLGSATGLRKIWKYKLVDISKVPEAYLLPPEERLQKKALNQIAKRDQETAHVPGIEFYYEDSLTSKAATNL
jgi:hypothetical protein